MKHLPVIVLMVLAVAACNLTDKFRKAGSSNSSSSGGSEKIGSDTVERVHPTAAQTAALANGREVKWDQQGISWTLPPNWKEQTVTNDSFNYGSGDGAFLIVSISPMSGDFPTEISLRAFHEGAKVREKNGQVDELKWLELDGARGVEFRESKPQMADDIRRLQYPGRGGSRVCRFESREPVARAMPRAHRHCGQFAFRRYLKRARRR